MNESKEKQKMIRYANRRGAKAFFITGVESGIPDFIVVKGDRYMLVEGKTLKGSMQSIQELFRDNIEVVGGKVYTIRTLAHFKKEFDRWVSGE